MPMYLPLVLMMIALVLGLSYMHESEVTADIQDEVNQKMAAPISGDK